ncbi:hypothetical protein QUF63_13130 [Anaerolineales bacterium HSG25]|nr:hypothetical protein [Anaerolineales bacterium HSG25]
MNLLEKAIALAVEKHQGQTDKQGQPYILHPLRVMFQLHGETAQIVGVLHDVVEDTDVTFDDLRSMGFSEVVIAGLDGVTRRDDETYEEFVARSSADDIAKQVKLADLTDNMDIRRLPNPLSEKDLARLQRYRQAWAVLGQQE